MCTYACTCGLRVKNGKCLYACVYVHMNACIYVHMNACMQDDSDIGRSSEIVMRACLFSSGEQPTRPCVCMLAFMYTFRVCVCMCICVPVCALWLRALVEACYLVSFCILQSVKILCRLKPSRATGGLYGPAPSLYKVVNSTRTTCYLRVWHVKLLHVKETLIILGIRATMLELTPLQAGPICIRA